MFRRVNRKSRVPLHVIKMWNANSFTIHISDIAALTAALVMPCVRGRWGRGVWMALCGPNPSCADRALIASAQSDKNLLSSLKELLDTAETHYTRLPMMV